MPPSSIGAASRGRSPTMPPSPLLPAGPITLLLLLLPLLLLPLAAQAQIQIGAGDDGYAEAFGRQGFAIHQHQQQQQYQAPRVIGRNPGFFPLGRQQQEGDGPAVIGPDGGAPPVREEKPSVYLVKLEKGKQLRYGGAGGVGRDEQQALALFKEVAYAPGASGPEKMMALYEAALLLTTGGKGVPQDFAAAVQLLSECLQFAEAKHTLAFYLATGFGGKPADEAAALKFDAAAAEGGSNGATLAMAYRYLYGIGGVEVEEGGSGADCERALAYYKEVATIAVQEYEAVPDLSLKRGVDEIAVLEARRAQRGGETDEAARRRLLGAAAAKDASGDALYEVAKMYDTGAYGLAPDPSRAVEFYEAAAAKGHAGAMGDLGILYALGSEAKEGPHGLPVRGTGLPMDLDLAVDLLERAAELGDAPATNALAYLYQNGMGVDRDEGKAEVLFRAAAMKDHPEALFHYGERMLEVGDLPSALAAFRRSGELGFIYGAYRAGMLHMEGVVDGGVEVIPRSCPLAAEAFKRAAEGGYWSAGARLGLDLYKRGELAAAVAVLCMAAEEGYEVAQANAAYLLQHRMGYSHDDAEELALRLYERAALQSDAHLYDLGDLMLRMEARGVDTTGEGSVGPVLGVAQALSYLEAAAAEPNNDVRALRRLAELYEKGEPGVARKDGGKALKYYRALLAALSEADDGGSNTWAAFVDRSHVQWKITTLSVKEGVGKFMGGGGEEGEEEGVRSLDDIKVVGTGKGRKAEGWMGGK